MGCWRSPSSPLGPVSWALSRDAGVLGGEMGKISRVVPSWWGFPPATSGADFEAFTTLVHSMNQSQVWEKSVGLGIQGQTQDFRDSKVSPSFFYMIIIKSFLLQAKPPSSLSFLLSF